MILYVTTTPHPCNKKLVSSVTKNFFYLKNYGIPKNIPTISLPLIGYLNSFRLPSSDVYLCEGPAELYPIYYKIKREGKVNKKVITMVRETTFFYFNKMPKFKQKFLMKLYSINDGFIADSELSKRYLQMYFNKPTEIAYPFALQTFFDVRPDLDKKGILFIGNDALNKGFLELVKAFKILRDMDSEWNLYLIGSCYKSVKEEFDGLHKIGETPNMKKYMKLCSLYVHPAHFEPFGISVLEAMSAGLIPIVTKNTGASEILYDVDSNIILNDNKPNNIAQKILDVYNYDREKKVDISKRCRKIVKQNFTENCRVKAFKKSFHRLIEMIK